MLLCREMPSMVPMSFKKDTSHFGNGPLPDGIANGFKARTTVRIRVIETPEPAAEGLADLHAANPLNRKAQPNA